MDLIIVESPAKARTIEGYLGRNYRVLSSYGHVRDLPKSKLGVDIEKDFQPTYRILDQARGHLAEIRKELKKAGRIYLATDLDREGEAIAWHLISALKLKSGSGRVKRITFNQVTKPALLEAIKNPRDIDQDLVDAQQARRILDRLVGYNLSPLLWKKIARGLSAGRVQSVAVRLIVDRERKIEEFKAKKYWQITASLEKDSKRFLAGLFKEDGKRLNRLAVDSQKRANQIKAALKDRQWQVEKISSQTKDQFPYPPYTTATLQRDAANRLGFSVKKTMFLAQKLYEGVSLGKGKSQGLITYMRTDSVHLARPAIAKARSYIKDNYPKELPVKARSFQGGKLAQEAHEAIRPIDPGLDPAAVRRYLAADQFRLYQLIWQRMIASQMKPIRYRRIKAEIGAGRYTFLAQGQQISRSGFGLVYPIKLKEYQLPSLKAGDRLRLEKLIIESKETQPPSRYSESTLVKELEKRGIGRPSTYAPIITTIQSRNYVEKRKGYFYPTEIGIVVNDLLVKNFAKIIDYQFTAKIEEELDQIARGQKKWVKVIGGFYRPFSRQLKEKESEIEKKEKKIGERCPECGRPLVKKFGRYGSFIACSNYPKCKYSRPLKDKKKIIFTKAEKERGRIALKKHPICPKCHHKMELKKGRYGIFLGCSNFPKCREMITILEKTGQKCPDCQKGDIVVKYTKRGKKFWGCSRYPKCRWASWQPPKGSNNSKFKVF